MHSFVFVCATWLCVYVCVHRYVHCMRGCALVHTLACMRVNRTERCTGCVARRCKQTNDHFAKMMDWQHIQRSTWGLVVVVEWGEFFSSLAGEQKRPFDE